MKFVMKQVQAPGFERILSQEVATGSGNPLECPLAKKIAIKSKNVKRCLWALGLPGALGPPGLL